MTAKWTLAVLIVIGRILLAAHKDKMDPEQVATAKRLLDNAGSATQ